MSGFLLSAFASVYSNLSLIGKRVAYTYTKPFDLLAEGLHSANWLPESDALQNGKGLLFEFSFGQLNATKGKKRLLSRESVLEAASVRINRPKTWSLKDLLRLAQECAKNLHDCPALTRKTLASQLQMTTARLNQILNLLRLVPEIQREILDLTPTAHKRLPERKLLLLLELNTKTQIEGFQKLLATRRSTYRK